MPHPAYGPQHRRVRQALMAELLAAPGKPCPICGEEMWPGTQAIDLHHSERASKLAGLPGDQLAHAVCNRGLAGTERWAKTIRRGAKASQAAAAARSQARSGNSREW